MQINLCAKEFEFENKFKNIGAVVAGFRLRISQESLGDIIFLAEGIELEILKSRHTIGGGGLLFEVDIIVQRECQLYGRRDGL